MENILIVGIILIFVAYLYRKFKAEYKEGSCSSCESEDMCKKKK